MREKVIIEQAGEDKYTIEAVIIVTCSGINIFVGGGKRPHIGTVVICQPRKSLKNNEIISCTSSVYNMLGHKDDIIAVPLAEAICKNTGEMVVVSAGIHKDNATSREIDVFIQNGEELKRKIIDALRKGKV